MQIPESNNIRQVQVLRVIDGDTFRLPKENGVKQRVRLIGVNTPESVRPNFPVEYLGPESKEFLQKLIEGRTVTLEFEERKYDRHKRILAFVFLDDIFVNAEIIRNGFSKVYKWHRFKQEYYEQFVKIEEEAREAGLGLWGKENSQCKS